MVPVRFDAIPSSCAAGRKSGKTHAAALWLVPPGSDWRSSRFGGGVGIRLEGPDMSQRNVQGDLHRLRFPRGLGQQIATLQRGDDTGGERERIRIGAKHTADVHPLETRREQSLPGLEARSAGAWGRETVAWRRATTLRCQRSSVSGRTSNRILPVTVRGIRCGSAASNDRSLALKCTFCLPS